MDNLLALVILMAIVFFAVYLAYFKQWEKLRKYTFQLILVAEKTFKGDKAGQERFEFVFENLYNKAIPLVLRPFITKTFIKNQIQAWYNEVKDYLDDGVRNDSCTS